MNSKSDLIHQDETGDENGDLASATRKEEDEEKSKTCETEICEDNKANIRIKVSSTDVDVS